MSFFTFVYNQLFVTLPKPTTPFSQKTVIVTGSNGGLGLEATRHFAKLNASKIIMAVRDIRKGEAARNSILESNTIDPSRVEVWQLDMSSYASVISFAERASQLPRIDVLVENAGVSPGQYFKDEEDERTITVNVVSTFLLALLLLPKLKESAKAYGTRPVVSIVTSDTHAFSTFPERHEKSIFAAFNKAEKYDMNVRYPTSKLLEILVVREWAVEHPVNDYPVTFNLPNPGMCQSELSREGGMILAIMKALLARTTEHGSRALVNAAEGGSETHGMYLSECRVTPPGGLVISDEGKTLQQRVWTELKVKLEKIKPGVTDNL